MALALQHPALEQLRQRLAATQPRALELPAGAPRPGERWGWAALAGRLSELSSATGAGTLTWAVRLAAQAQEAGRPVAWVQTLAGGFYPPDAAANGVALDALAVVRVPDTAALARAAERLARSGGFALVVLDLLAAGPRALLPPALAGRLVQHALRHGTAVLCLTEKPARAASLGALVSLRALALRRRAGLPEGAPVPVSLAPAPVSPAPAAPAFAPPGRFVCALEIAKDKRGGPGWGQELACDGPPGLR